jgi:PAS domain S-box-containing protein
VFRATSAEVGGYTLSSAEYIRRFVHPDDAEVISKAISAARDAPGVHQSHELQHRILYSDGEIGYVAVRMVIVRDKRGRAVTTYGVNQDITEYKDAERRISERESQYRSLVEQQVAGINIVRDDGTFAYVNPRFAEMLGYRPEELVGKRFYKFVGEADRAKLRKLATARFSGEGSIRPTEFSILRKDGSLVDILGQATLATYQGRPALFAVTIDDSEHKRAERAMRHTIEALASTVELRDPYTAGHQQRVSKLACAIARDLGMSEAQIEGLSLAGAVHDVGKVKVPAEILNKPGRLTKLEYQLTQEHVQAGYDILKGVEFPWPVAQIVLQHHERLDGSGYPNALKGDAILLEARILAVADVVDSMTSRRPYRDALGIDAALNEIESGRGRLYDPQVAAACDALFRNKRFALQ